MNDLSKGSLKILDAFALDHGLDSLDKAVEVLSRQENKLRLALSFDDVTLVQRYSDFLPDEADVRTKISRNIDVNIPFVSAAMDTVTESEMAIEMAQLGGNGVIHRNMSIERQCEEVRKTKNAWNLVVQNPLTVKPSQTLRDVRRLMNETSYGGFPVVKWSNVLVGIITEKDTKYNTNLDVKVESLMTPVNESFHYIRYGTHFSQRDYFKFAETGFKKWRVDHLPVVVRKEGKYVLKGLITHEDVRKRREYKHACLKSERLIVGAAIGCNLHPKKGEQGDLGRAEALIHSGVDYLVIDASHGYCKGVLDTLKAVREVVGDDIDIITGNVCVPEAVKDLVEAGSSGIKVGVGPGSICTTRTETGAGIPQISAIYEVAMAAREYSLPVGGDGGFKVPGDAAKGIAAGAWYVMLGSGVAGTLETPGPLIERDGRRFKNYDGMGSLEAMARGSSDRYKEEGSMRDLDLREYAREGLPLAQGIPSEVEYKGPIFKVINEWVRGVQHGMGITGCKTLEELRDLDKFYSKFRQVTTEGHKEGTPHIMEGK